MASTPRLLRVDRGLPRVLYAVMAIQVVSASAILVRLTPRIARADWPSIAFFAALSGGAELLPVVLPRGGAVSVSFAINFAGLFLFGPAAAGWMTAVGGAVSSIRRRSSLQALVFNTSMGALTASVSGMVYEGLGGQLASVTLVRSGPSLMGAAVCFFVLNSVLLTVPTATLRKASYVRTWVANYRWLVPSYLALAPLGVLIGVVYLNVGVPGTLLFFVPLLIARYSFQQYVEIRRIYVGTVKALAAALEAKDDYTHGHSERVAAYATIIAREMRLSEADVERVEQTALLHDIGKIGISQDLLNKVGDLSSDEFNNIKQHAVIGANILKETTLLAGVSDAVRSHHERYDGRGYPLGLSRGTIPLAARILAVADAFDAMTSARPYRPPISADEAADRILVAAGRQFDSEVVAAFRRAYERGDLAIPGRK